MGGTSSCSAQAAVDLTPIPGGGGKIISGPGWNRANIRTGATNEYINGGNKLRREEGGFPFPMSYHPGQIMVTFCDGSVRPVNETIDGTVWAKVITPAGESLPYNNAPLQANPRLRRRDRPAVTAAAVSLSLLEHPSTPARLARAGVRSFLPAHNEAVGQQRSLVGL